MVQLSRRGKVQRLTWLEIYSLNVLLRGFLCFHGGKLGLVVQLQLNLDQLYLIFFYYRIDLKELGLYLINVHCPLLVHGLHLSDLKGALSNGPLSLAYLSVELVLEGVEVILGDELVEEFSSEAINHDV